MRPRGRGMSTLRAEAPHYALASSLGGVPVARAWRHGAGGAPQAVVLCDRSRDREAEARLRREEKLAALAAADAALKRAHDESEMRSARRAAEERTLAQVRAREARARAELRARVLASTKPFILRATLQRTRALDGNLEQSRAQAAFEEERKSQLRQVRTARRAQIEATRRKDAQRLALTARVNSQREKEKEEALRTALEQERSEEEEKQAEMPGSVSPPRRKASSAASALTPFHPPSPLHSSRAVPVDDRSPSFAARMSSAQVDWRATEGIDAAYASPPRRDLKAHEARMAERERLMREMQQRERRVRRVEQIAKQETQRKIDARGAAKKQQHTEPAAVAVDAGS